MKGLCVAGGSAVLLLLVLYQGVYRYVFGVKRDRTVDPHRLPSGEQFRALYETIHPMVDAACALPCEEVTILSRDKLTLFGRYYEVSPDAPVMILFHGYRSNPFRDFYGILPGAMELGCNVLLVTQRAHERSEGKVLTFGILERLDCLCWAEYAAARFGREKPVFLLGLSMGAATVTMAAGLDLPPNVRGIIADCGYSSPREIICKVIRDLHCPVKPGWFLIRLTGRLFGGFDLESASSIKALSKTAIPVLLIHGEDDRFVPCSMSRENYAACTARKTLFTFPAAGHGLSYVTDPAAYRKVLKHFLQDCGGFSESGSASART